MLTLWFSFILDMSCLWFLCSFCDQNMAALFVIGEKWCCFRKTKEKKEEKNEKEKRREKYWEQIR